MLRFTSAMTICPSTSKKKQSSWAMCFTPQNDAVTRASGLSAFSLPENINSADLVGYARDEYKTIFAKGLGKNASRVLGLATWAGSTRKMPDTPSRC